MISAPTVACLKRAALGAARAIAFVCAAGFFAMPVSAQSDADFLKAKDAFEHGDRARLDALANGLKGHLLAPYVTYWQIKLRLDDIDYDTVRSFLSQYPNTPLAETTSYAYDPASMGVAAVTNANGETSTATYDAKTNRVLFRDVLQPTTKDLAYGIVFNPRFPGRIRVEARRAAAMIGGKVVKPGASMKPH